MMSKSWPEFLLLLAAIGLGLFAGFSGRDGAAMPPRTSFPSYREETFRVNLELDWPPGSSETVQVIGGSAHIVGTSFRHSDVFVKKTNSMRVLSAEVGGLEDARKRGLSTIAYELRAVGFRDIRGEIEFDPSEAGASITLHETPIALPNALEAQTLVDGAPAQPGLEVHVIAHQGAHTDRPHVFVTETDSRGWLRIQGIQYPALVWFESHGLDSDSSPTQPIYLTGEIDRPTAGFRRIPEPSSR